MNQIQQIITFVGSGLNWDDAKSAMPVGDSRHRLNCTVEGSGVFGTIANMRGNNAFTLPFTLPTGTNKIVGWCEDIERNAGVFFLYNSGGNHAIFRWLLSNNQVDRIAWNSNVLNMNPNQKVHANVNGDLLYWSDGGSPKKINMERGILTVTRDYPDNSGIGYWYVEQGEPQFIVS